MNDEKQGLTGKRASAIRVQYAALPYRVTAQGTLEILLITSRGTGRWVIPKGWPMKSRTPPKAAAQEAFEEAGLRGSIAAKSIGSFAYDKYLNDSGRSVPCAVQVFPMLVKKQLDAWPEDAQRQTQWFAPAEAAGLVDEPDLRALILEFAEKKTPRAKA